MKSKAPDRGAAAKRAALNALRRASRAAERAGVKLSDWEDEFLGSVSERVKTYGRAFADPEKGGPGQPLSMMQAAKLKEISRKAKGETAGKPQSRDCAQDKTQREGKPPARSSFKPRTPPDGPAKGRWRR